MSWAFLEENINSRAGPKNKGGRGTCGAKTRKGTPCNAPPVWDKKANSAKNGRCKLHGGLSTGAKTEAGLQAIRDGVRASNIMRGKRNKEHTQSALVAS